MQTVRDIRKNSEQAIIPNGYVVNGWSSVLSHEMNVLFHALCAVVAKYESKEEMNHALDQVKGLQGTFSAPEPEKFKSPESYNNYVKLLEKHKKFLERSRFAYPASREEAMQLFIKWGLLLDQGDVWDIPVSPFPDAQEIFVLTETEQMALSHIKLEALVHPVFSQLVLMLHEKEENSFSFSKAELKEMLKINDAMLTEVLIKLTPYMQEPIENMLDIPDDQKMSFTVVWERIYEDYLGDKYQEIVQ
jgi:hypothetical protein